MTKQRKVAVVAGVGPGNGAALTRRFVEAGYAVAMLARTRDTLESLEKEIDGASRNPPLSRPQRLHSAASRSPWRARSGRPAFTSR